jgi:hypothetical protein
MDRWSSAVPSDSSPHNKDRTGLPIPVRLCQKSESLSLGCSGPTPLTPKQWGGGRRVHCSVCWCVTWRQKDVVAGEDRPATTSQMGIRDLLRAHLGKEGTHDTTPSISNGENHHHRIAPSIGWVLPGGGTMCSHTPLRTILRWIRTQPRLRGGY